jgi:hypothetical protein
MRSLVVGSLFESVRAPVGEYLSNAIIYPLTSYTAKNRRVRPLHADVQSIMVDCMGHELTGTEWVSIKKGSPALSHRLTNALRRQSCLQSPQFHIVKHSTGDVVVVDFTHTKRKAGAVHNTIYCISHRSGDSIPRGDFHLA